MNQKGRRKERYFENLLVQDWGEDLGGRSASQVPKPKLLSYIFDQDYPTAFNNLVQLLRTCRAERSARLLLFLEKEEELLLSYITKSEI
jgi:hypothetical protein